MRPEAQLEVRFRQLGSADRPAVARIAGAAFRASGFYARALGLEAGTLERYWDPFFDLALADRAAAVYALERGGEVVAAVATAFDGFPGAWNGLRFLWRLLLRFGLARLVRYLAFVWAYGRVMRRPIEELRIEARGLWLFVDPAASSAGLGSLLVREAMREVRRRGKTLMTGFVDVSDAPLLAFYRRHGFSVSAPFPIAGGRGAVVEHRAGREPRPC